MPLPGTGVTMTEMEKICDRCADLLWLGFADFSPVDSDLPDGNRLYDTLRPDGSWPDIDYNDQNRTYWDTAKHYQRMLLLLKQAGPGRLAADSEFCGKLTAALSFWVEHDFKNPNWWYNEIGVPRDMGDVLFLMLPYLSDDLLARAADAVRAGSMVLHEDYCRRWTGANRLWGAVNTLKHALIIGDEAALLRAVEIAGETLTIVHTVPRPDQHWREWEGIQPDGSFFQHGPRLYSGGYGRSYAFQVAWIAYILKCTEYQLPTDKLEIFLHHVLDGLRYMMHGRNLDYITTCREFTRANATDAGLIELALAMMAETEGLPRQVETRAFLEEVRGGARCDRTKFFPDAMLLTHHTGGLYIGVKMQNSHLWGAEECNGEGILFANLAYGSHSCIMKSGLEYRNIAPLWDYARIPGTTAFAETDEELASHLEEWRNQPLPSDHAGGAGKGSRALIYERAEHDGISCLVTCFAFEGGAIFLGADLSYPEGRGIPVTTAEQCLKNGEITVTDGAVIHNGIRWEGLDGTVLEPTAEFRRGSWKRNSTSISDIAAEGEIFTLTVKPGSDRYVYRVSPADFEAPWACVLRNDEAVQAIRLADGRIMAVFHIPGTYSLDGRTVCGEGAYIE